MTVLLVVGGLVLLLAVACYLESRSGRPAWGAHLGTEAPSTHAAARAAKKSIVATIAFGAFLGMDGDG